MSELRAGVRSCSFYNSRNFVRAKSLGARSCGFYNSRNFVRAKGRSQELRHLLQILVHLDEYFRALSWVLFVITSLIFRLGFDHSYKFSSAVLYLRLRYDLLIATGFRRDGRSRSKHFCVSKIENECTINIIYMFTS